MFAIITSDGIECCLVIEICSLIDFFDFISTDVFDDFLFFGEEVVIFGSKCVECVEGWEFLVDCGA